MKQFATILRFEVKGYFKNKIFVGITLFLMGLIALVMFFPRFSSFFEGMKNKGGASPTTNEETGEDTRPVMLIALEDALAAEDILAAFSQTFGSYDVRMAGADAGEIKKQISSGQAECAFVLHSPTAYTYYVGNLSMTDRNPAAADETLLNIYRINNMVQEGLSSSQAEQILSASISHKTENLGKDQIQNFFYTYIMIFALYMVIILYGQMVATNVATEKSSRAMELLITSAKPASMMFGKVIASCLAGFLQLLCVFGSAFLFFNLNKSQWGDNQVITSLFDMPLGLLLYMLLFFVLGFFMYAFLFGAVGSTASKVEDINTSVMPITLVFIAAFLVVMMSMSSGEVDSPLMVICSYLPFTSPMAMFTRIAMSTVPVYEVVVSVAILVVSVAAVGILSAKIYRVGVLLYGTTPKIGTVLKSVWKA